MKKKHKYSIGDIILISKKLSKSGGWVDIPSQEAKILRIKEGGSFGPAYVLLTHGFKSVNCYWESDIDGYPEKKHDCVSNPK
jgi:hypothetical protein